ncbi:methylmalonyl-CoA epimerase [Haloarcula sp. S1CR25-12]|uniref:Methylmalonyl-CoA epimerase n=1 Tax=Haloarcula saliterrae TaxID=2950534 RepID=A0ABU2FGP3_9EURY|nr:methylmalonyl-CoA epimerase [Haloarcula sp. S1CR25-12]MDS0261428.1 methylmalonyl-CoA epimerase [Haloarcula sp. S1CR25-12]
MQFDHAGLATDDVAELSQQFAALFEVDIVHEETFDGMKIAFLDFGNGYFELLEPMDSGPISRHLERNGPGIHHLAVETEDLESALARARDAGVELIDERPREGAWGHSVAFLHPRDTGGILLEFVEH